MWLGIAAAAFGGSTSTKDTDVAQQMLCNFAQSQPIYERPYGQAVTGAAMSKAAQTHSGQREKL